jgi:hypothetical protein
MGQGQAKLTPGDLKICRQVSSEVPGGVADGNEVKRLLAKYKSLKGERGISEEIHSPSELQIALEALQFFKKQGETYRLIVRQAAGGADGGSFQKPSSPSSPSLYSSLLYFRTSLPLHLLLPLRLFLYVLFPSVFVLFSKVLQQEQQKR